MKALLDRAANFLRRWDGRLTQELVLHPAQFGLGKVPARLRPDDVSSMICGFCSTGCSLNVHLKNGQAVNLTPDKDYPVNLGMACPKGWEALTPLSARDRVTTPLLRGSHGNLEPIDWDTALQIFTLRFKAIMEQHGPESVAFISTGQIVCEEMALLGALAKFGMGMIHGDGNTRQCMATAVTAYKESFGFDAPPYTYQDFEESDVIVLVGSNLCIAHPILWQRICRNRHEPEIIVVDPRTTETALAATQHYAIKPKADLLLFYALAHRFIKKGWLQREFIDAHTEGFTEFVEHVTQFPPERVLPKLGLSAAEFDRLAETIHQGRRVSFWWTMGVNQGHEATRTAQAIINLALMTGNIGRAGTGANSITGQCNAMGSRLFSNTTNLLGGHNFTDPTHREKIARILKIKPDLIPSRNSLAYDQILQGVADGKIKGLWIVATNPGHSWIHQKSFHEAAKQLDFCVVQDMYYTTETARVAHLVLPAAAWGEKEGTFINSERRIGLVKKLSRAPGEALADFHIFKLIAQYWGCGDVFRRWTSPEAVFQILKEVTRGQPCDITGIENYQMIEAAGGIQWPYPDQSNERERARTSGNDGQTSPDRLKLPEATSGKPAPTPDWRGAALARPLRPHEIGPSADPATKWARQAAPGNDPASSSSISRAGIPTQRRLFEDGRFFHRNGRAQFRFDPPIRAPELPDSDYPFFLLTGRGSSAQWHTQSRTAKSAVLRKLYPDQIYVEINPDDAKRLGIETGELVEVSSRRGQLEAVAFVTGTVASGQVFIPMHYVATNELTFPAFDPWSRQPAYKSAAVKIVKR
jgi:anaerobic selenocysteine-containing dehydrogenase